MSCLCVSDCPQVQAIRAYAATQPDELSLEESDVINVFKKMADGKCVCVLSNINMLLVLCESNIHCQISLG